MTVTSAMSTRLPVKEEEYLNLWDSDSEDEFYGFVRE